MMDNHDDDLDTTLTTSELISMLQRLPPDTPVVLLDGADEYIDAGGYSCLWVRRIDDRLISAERDEPGAFYAVEII